MVRRNLSGCLENMTATSTQTSAVPGHLGPGGAPGGDGMIRPSPHRTQPWALRTSSVAVAVVLVLPVVFLLIEAHGAGLSNVVRDIDRSLTATLLWNTVRLTVVVTLLCAVIGVGAAWCIERTDLPGRRLWAVLVVLPVAIPDFVVSFGWASLTTWIQGFRGAVVVMTLALYPLVYLPVAASLRGADPGQEEVARSLGMGRLQTFWRITIGQARVAVMGGCLLVALVMLAEYGAFEILGYRTFTTEIFTEYNVSFNVSSACALSLVLVVLSLVVLGGDAAARGRGRVSRSGAFAQRVASPACLGRATAPVMLSMLCLVALSVGVPIGAVCLLDHRGQPFLDHRRLAPVGRRPHRAVRRVIGRLGDDDGASRGTAVGPPFEPLHPGAREKHLPGAGRARGRRRLGPLLLRRTLRPWLPLPKWTHARRRLCDLVLPFGSCLRARLGDPGPGFLRGGRALPGTAPAEGLGAGDPSDRRPRTGGRILPGVPVGGDRAHRNPVVDTDRGADPGHAVLGVPTEPRLRPSGAVRARHDRHCGGSERHPRTVVRPPPVARHGGSVTGLVVSGVYKSFGPVPVLSGIDLSVPEGAFAAVLGPSGSGKTTLFRVLAGFERADAGTVTLGGVTIEGDGRHVVPEQRGVGYVPQEAALFPHLTVEANIAFGLHGQAHHRRHHGEHDHDHGDHRDRQGRRNRYHYRRRRVAELLETVGLGGLDKRYPHQLSGGQQQRVALARALAIEPRLVLLDEPFGSLDASMRASVRADVRRTLAETGTTAILVTHDQDEALSLADQLAVLRDGRIAQQGTPREVYFRPVDAELAQFLGSANLLEGIVDASGSSVTTSIGHLPLDRGRASAGAKVLVLIRPEQIVLSRPAGDGAGRSDNGSGSQVGRVIGYDFHGHDATVKLSIDAVGPHGVATLVARASGSPYFDRGSEVVLERVGPRHGVGRPRTRGRGTTGSWTTEQRSRRGLNPGGGT